MLSHLSLFLTFAFSQLGLLFNQKRWQVVMTICLNTAWIQQYSYDCRMSNTHLFESFVETITFYFSLLCPMKWFAFFQFIWHMCTELYSLSRKENCQKLSIITETLKFYTLRINKIYPCGITGLWLIREWKPNHFIYAVLF